MNNGYIEDLRKQVKKALKEDKMRYRHTLGVADTSACLAMRYGVDMQKAYIAGLLHDCAKCVPDTVKLEECNRYGIEVTEFEKNSLYLLHAKLGAYYAKELYHIEDASICSAIYWHTTGHAGMTKLEEIVYIADYIEQPCTKSGYNPSTCFYRFGKGDLSGDKRYTCVFKEKRRKYRPGNDSDV